MAYYCPNCGEPVKNKDKFCQSCGRQLVDELPDIDYSARTHTETAGNVQYQSQAANFYESSDENSVFEESVDPYEEYRRHTYDYNGRDAVRPDAPSYRYSARGEYFADPSWPVRSKIAAGVLGILLGGLGIHKFYLGKVGQGILMMLFCWTGIPGIIGLIQGIIYLTQSDEEFSYKNQVRVE